MSIALFRGEEKRRTSRKLLLSGLRSSQYIHAAVRREIARADRNNRPFTLVLFRANSGWLSSFSTLRLARAVLARARATDDVGWFDEQHLAIILPETDVQGSRIFVRGVRQRFNNATTKPLCAIYSYPLESLDNGDDEGGGGGRVPGMEDSVDLLPVNPMQALMIRPMPLWKRAIDVVGATAGLLLLWPFFALVAAAVKFTSPGPVLFPQRRTGLGGIPFTMYKFRTMVPDAERRQEELRAHNEQDGPAFKLRNDPRLTPLGRILRKTSIDELPQLWNVLKGDMTLVGPRPLPVAESLACRPWQRRRLDVTPGLTCIWQVKGRSSVPFAEWIRMDLEYIRSRGIWQDVKILVLTVPAVLLRRGAH